jgi:phosphatidate phosphatase APP1
VKHPFRGLLGSKDPLTIVPYSGYGTPHKLYLQGRVLENKGISAAADGDSRWDNLVNMYKRFTGAGVSRARVRARFQDTEREFVTDSSGYFDGWVESSQPLQGGGLWHEVELELAEPRRRGAQPVRATARALVPPPDSQFAVISDIDDTVIHTDAVNLLRMASIVFLGNARTRLPLKGVAGFYRALFRGNGQVGVNPLFYVSNSPWNLYDLLCDFFHLHDIPIGPVLFLRRWGFTRKERLPTRKREHKLASARNILDLFPHLPFILVGDSGEKDPEIYAELVSEYPQRIRAVYIRNASRKLQRPAEVQALADQVIKAGCTLILADDTWPLAQHAARQGWITPASLVDIDAERQKDATPPNPIAQLLGQEEEETPAVVIGDTQTGKPGS